MNTSLLELNETALLILSEWSLGANISAKRVFPEQNSMFLVKDDSDRAYILRTKPTLAGLEKDHRMLEELAKRGIPVALPIPTATNQDYVERNGAFYCLYPFS